MPCDVILDSGADTSALSLRFSGVGTACPSPNTTFVDAQGSPLAVESTRLATVQFGDVIFREKFIVADVTTPLIALGFGPHHQIWLEFGAAGTWALLDERWSLHQCVVSKQFILCSRFYFSDL